MATSYWLQSNCATIPWRSQTDWQYLLVIKKRLERRAIIMQSSRRPGYAVGICFMFFWVCGVSWIGIMAVQSGAPLFFAFAAFGMAVLGIMAIVSFVRQIHAPQELPLVTRHTTYSGASPTEYVLSQTQGRKIVYQVPSRCPFCGAPISNEEVDWVGPLQAKCPSCMSSINVEERGFQ